MHSTNSVDKFFLERGAVNYCESFYPPQRHWTLHEGTTYVSRVFSIHYFNADAEEIGYWIPDLAEFTEPHVFETVRLWPEGHEQMLKQIPAV